MALVLIFGSLQPMTASAATTVDLGTAETFAVLAGTAISDTAPSVITGDVGLSPAAGTNITGLTSGEVSGTIYAVDANGPDGASGNEPAFVNGAKTDLVAAYSSASQVTTGVIAADLGGQTLTAGVYDDNDAPNSLSIDAGETLTLDAEGDADAVFIFKTGSTLTTGAGSTVSLINGASACNVFWQIGSSATLGTGTTFAGNILALTSITDDGGATVNGRLLARNGAVTLNDTTVTVPDCADPEPPASGPSFTGSINVVKIVINDNGGTATIDDFPLFVNGTAVVSGRPGNFTAGTYTITETSNANYTQSFSGSCDAAGRLTLSAFETTACIVTNDDIGTPAVIPPAPPIITVVKVPSPLSLPDGPGPVTYTFTLNNIGTVAVTNVTMIDDTCSPAALISGDTNGDAALDISETWTYSCSALLSETHTNTVVATGWANGLSTTDIAFATVVVGEPIIPPFIHVTKVPDPLTLLAGGGLVTYTETITNPGEVALENVTLTDDKCSPVNYISGDTNGDNRLDPNEAWVHTCQDTLTVTTTNIATATGEANGLTATDFAVVTVLVAESLPSLPNAGIAPLNRNLALPIIAANLGVITVLGYLTLKKLSV